MKLFRLSLLLMPVLAGCLSKAPPRSDNWLIEFDRASGAALPAAEVGKPLMRISTVDVRVPYNGQRLAVLRGDGSVAFDPFNSFAAPPAQLLRGVAQDAVTASGRYLALEDHGITRRGGSWLKVVVSRLAFDCRNGGPGEALVELSLVVASDQSLSSVTSGRASVPVEGGDFSAAFSKSFQTAFDAAFAKIAD